MASFISDSEGSDAPHPASQNAITAALNIACRNSIRISDSPYVIAEIWRPVAPTRVNVVHEERRAQPPFRDASQINTRKIRLSVTVFHRPLRIA
jgi:hypothetical protein